MDHRLICEWLRLPPDRWPPDPYQLVGIEPSALTHALLEKRVQQRIELVRRYQLAHPDECTEALNRLAQAYVSLSASPSEPDVAEAPVILETDAARTELGKEGTRTSSDPQVRTAEAPVISQPATSAVRTPVPLPAAAAGKQVLTTEPATTPALVLTATSRRSLYQRLALVRRLLRAWRAFGPYVSDTGWRINRSADADALTTHATELAAAARSLPTGLGRAGEAGYLVLALAKQQVIVATFQTLLPGQRDALARDWVAAKTVLEGQLASLRGAVRERRKKLSWQRYLVRLAANLADHPGLILLLLAALALFVAGWRTLTR